MGDRPLPGFIPLVVNAERQPPAPRRFVNPTSPSPETAPKLRKSVPSIARKKVRCQLLRPADTRLSKPPRVHAPRVSVSTRKLQRRRKPQAVVSETPKFYLLFYEPYPYGSTSRKLLGIFSDLYTTAAAAGACGATLLPQESPTGELTYLTRTGRLKICAEGIRGGVYKSPRTSREGGGTLSSPNQTLRDHHGSRAPSITQNDTDRIIFLAMEEGSGGLSCKGVYTEKEKAWMCCMKRYNAISPSVATNATTWVDEDGMTHMTGRISGTGLHHWYVGLFRVDELLEISSSA